MSHRPPARRRRAARGGFTLIEIMIVVALLVVLSSLLIMGIGKMQLSAKKQQTTLLLHNLQSMWAEYDAVTHPKFPPLATPCPGSVTADRSSNAAGQVDGNSNDRFRGAVQLTRSLFSVMRSVPNVRAGFDKVPPSQLMVNTVVTAYASNPWQVGVSYDFASQSPTAQYCTVADASGGYAVYLCTQANTATVSNRPPDTRFWFPYTSDPTARVVTDAWGGPILVCFGGALGSAVVPPVAVAARKVNVAGASLDNLLFVNGTSTVLTSPDGRLFFASAGPDGDFGAGDDNVYSFEH